MNELGISRRSSCCSTCALLAFLFVMGSGCTKPVPNQNGQEPVAAITIKGTGAQEKEKKSSDGYVKYFPLAGDGMVRYVIRLPFKTRQDERNYRVELLIGKERFTDGVNHLRFGGTIKEKPLKGKGFIYYEVEKLGPTISTLVGVPPGSPSVKKFVTIRAKQIPYNSRVPIMIYVPKDAQVRYRIWEAPKIVEKAKQG